MKKFFTIAVCMTALAACNQNGGKNDSLSQQRDSLNHIIAMKENEIEEIMAIVNEIEEGFRAINEAENRVSIVRSESNDKERIKQQLNFIQQKMEQNKQLIEKLNKQIKNSTFKSQQIKRTVDNLIQQMEEKDAQIAQLTAELADKNTRISELDSRVSNLSTSVSALQEDSTSKAQTITMQEKQINTAWFVFGTKGELKEQRIYIDGKVLQGDFNKDYFTQIDIRKDKQIQLFSRHAKMLTSHPINSYTLEKGIDKQYTLTITDPQQFWSTSKYLVILVK